MVARDSSRGDSACDGFVQNRGVARLVLRKNVLLDGLTRHTLTVGVRNDGLDNFLWKYSMRRSCVRVCERAREKEYEDKTSSARRDFLYFKRSDPTNMRRETRNSVKISQHHIQGE